MALRRRSSKPSLLDRVLKAIAISRFVWRGWRLYRKGRRLIAAALFAGALGVVVRVIARRRRPASGPMTTYAPTPTPTVSPGPPPLDASGHNGAVVEPPLSAEKRAS